LYELSHRASGPASPDTANLLALLTTDVTITHTGSRLALRESHRAVHCGIERVGVIPVTTVVRVVVLCILSLVAVLWPSSAAGGQTLEGPYNVPSNIQVGDFLKPSVRTLLDTSRTFRRQCDVIAAARMVRILLVAVPEPRLSTAPRARATIGRHAYGLMRAVIELPVTGDHSELIPHELEHVIEQIEGLNLAALARAGDDDVTEVANGVFETARARAAGRAASREALGFVQNDPPGIHGARTIMRMWRGLSSRATRPGTPTPLRIINR
jgi:hypothetical protein